MKIIGKLSLSLIAAAGLLHPLAEAAEKPLLMEGKQTLYQRVLIKPDTKLFQKADKASTSTDSAAFSVLYVYQRKTIDGQPWLKLGSDIHGQVTGWVKADRTIPWNQGLTVSFKDTSEDNRVMLFKDKDSLKTAVEGTDLKRYQALYEQAVEGKRDSDSPVVAVAPVSLGELKDNFYLVPILDHEDTWLGNHRATLLNVATVSLAGDTAEEELQARPDVEPAQVKTLETGIMFVIDSTLSMGPYIERTREAVRKIQQDLTHNTSDNNLHFGLIAYRDNLSTVPELDYVAETFAPLTPDSTAEQFLSQVGNVGAANVSSQDFSEDAYAGLKQALDNVEWEKFKARYIVLITDAGAREADDPLSSTGLSTADVQKLASDKKVATVVLHLKTPLGAAYHADTQTQYEALSTYPGVGSLYYGVDTGNVQQFGSALDTLAGQIRGQVVLEEVAPAKEEPEAEKSRLSALQEKISKIGYALRMQYLKSDQQEPIPEIIDAWIVDRNVQSPAEQSVEVRVLLTRDQLSDLHDVMREVLGSFEEGLLSPRNFFEDLKSVAANLSRDPEQLKGATGTNNLASMGVMGEYIDDLPYQSPAMAISADEWALWSPEQQIQFTHKLEEKIAYYKALYEHPDLWTTPGGGAVDGHSVITLPLTMMP